MNYADGQQVRLGDKVHLGGGFSGTVVCVIDDAQYSDDYPLVEWSYLNTGALVLSEQMGLVHYSEPDKDLALFERSSRQR